VPQDAGAPLLLLLQIFNLSIISIAVLENVSPMQGYRKEPPFFLEAFCDISHKLGGITPFGVFSDAFPGLKIWVTFACATANFLTHFIISIAVLENVPPDAGLQKRATFPH
jgi:hypothetical protein